MFTPNLQGDIYKLDGRDVHGQNQWSVFPLGCPFAIVNMEIEAKKTSVRADSSASRGSADQTSADRAKVLMSKIVNVDNGDKFTFDGQDYLVVSVHTRRSVFGPIDHFEVDLEILP